MSVSLIREEDDLTESGGKIFLFPVMWEKWYTLSMVLSCIALHRVVKYFNNLRNNCTALGMQDDTHCTMKSGHLHGIMMKGYWFIYKISNELKIMVS